MSVDPGSRRRWRDAAAAALLAGLSACTTLPAEEATAFRKVAAANRDAFTGITQAQRDAATALAVRNVAEADGEVRTENCGPDDAADCTIAYGPRQRKLGLAPPAANIRHLIGAVAEYGERMADLAEAKDIEELNGKAEAAGGAVRGLFAAVGLAPAGGLIVDAALLAYRGKLARRRQHLLLGIAERAKPAIDAAAAAMGKAAKDSRDAIVTESADAVVGIEVSLAQTRKEAAALDARAERLRGLMQGGSRWAETTLDSVEAQRRELRVRRAAQFLQLADAARHLNSARGLKVDFRKLAESHDDLLARLRDPSASTEQTLANLNQFLDILDDVAALGKSS